MELYFTCPNEKVTFASNDYSLHEGHSIVEVKGGEKELLGIVSLNSGCPLCGQKHLYEVKDVICTLNGGGNGK